MEKEVERLLQADKWREPKMKSETLDSANWSEPKVEAELEGYTKRGSRFTEPKMK